MMQILAFTPRPNAEPRPKFYLNDDSEAKPKYWPWSWHWSCNLVLGLDILVMASAEAKILTSTRCQRRCQKYSLKAQVMPEFGSEAETKILVATKCQNLGFEPRPEGQG